ncbi:lytic transglycosylase domain-containing protein, partial [Escherichia coli]|uniref:lytic transglycosylase domain-containing protein n=1 Tax=Escherichia coli TaxID=562 RepID=UPI0020239D5B
MKKIILSIILISNYCYASDCFEITGKAYNIDPLILKAIAWNESKCKSGIKSKTNKNRTYDIGIMQINSSHLDLLSKFNISEDDLLNDLCIHNVSYTHLTCLPTLPFCTVHTRRGSEHK